MELQFTERHIMALNALLAAVLIYFAALAVNDVLRIGGATDQTPAQHARTKVAHDLSANRPRAAYQAIVERDIFNLEPPPAAPAPVVEEDLHLTLIGVTQTTKGKPYAIIANQVGEQSVYQVGDNIPDSGKLVKVEKDRAIIEHGGKDVAIELPSDNPSDADAAPSPSAAANEAPSAQQTPHQDRGRFHRRLRRHHFE